MFLGGVFSCLRLARLSDGDDVVSVSFAYPFVYLLPNLSTWYFVEPMLMSLNWHWSVFHGTTARNSQLWRQVGRSKIKAT